MSMSFGIAPVFAGAKASLRRGALSDVIGDAADRALPFLTKTGGELKKWGKQDWDHFKQTYRPVADAIVDDANQEPDYARYERDATVAAAQAGRDDNAAIVRSGVNPASGRFADATIRSAGNKAASEGGGQAMGRLRADQVSTGKKLNAINMGRPDPSSAIAGLGVVSKSGSEYGKYSGAIGNTAARSMGNAGFGIGQTIGNYRPSTNENGPNSTPPNESPNEAVNYNAYDDAGYADGGIIDGPGTGRSDSIPAVIDGKAPARVSDGEYHIAANVVARIGKARLDGLLALSRG
jgi:hypothetical protein